MLNNLKVRRDREDGFTLIELMVVVLIIAILIAIAIPTFLGARDRAEDRAAQSSLRNALTAAKTAYTDSSDYSTAQTYAQLNAIEPSLTYGDGSDATAASDGPKDISVNVSTDNQTWSAAALSKSGKCFGMSDVATGSGSGTFYITVDSAKACTGANAVGATGQSW